MIVYSLVNKILRKNKINSPKLIRSYLKNNIIEITDLGNKSFFEYIKLKKNKLKEYKKAIDLIIKLQKLNLKNSTLTRIKR